MVEDGDGLGRGSRIKERIRTRKFAPAIYAGIFCRWMGVAGIAKARGLGNDRGYRMAACV